jgi:hypothetical protein
MSRQDVRAPFAVLLVTLVLTLVIAQPLAAKEDTGQVEVQGTVLSINAAAGTFQVQEEAGSVHTIVPPAGFDLTSLRVGDSVEVKGTLNADGSVSAVSIKIEQAGEGQADKSGSFYCAQSEVENPVGARLAEQYEVPYATVQGWFCEGFGWGQVKHALQTAKLTGVDAAALLQQRLDGQGWGQIWQSLKLIGRSRTDRPSHELAGKPQSGGAGKSNAMKAKGKPVVAGQPDGMKGKGKPAAEGRSDNGKGKK